MSIQPLASNSYHEKTSFCGKKICPITTKNTSQIALKALTGHVPLESLEKLKKPFLSNTSSFQNTPLLNPNTTSSSSRVKKKAPVPPRRSDKTQLTPSVASICAAKSALKSSIHIQKPSIPNPSSSTSCLPEVLPLFKKVDAFVVNNPLASGSNSPSSKKKIPSPPTEELSPKANVSSWESEIQKLNELLEEFKIEKVKI